MRQNRSLGVIALLDYLGLVVFLLSLVVFPFLFSYFINPTSTKLENGREIILNSRGIDITKRAKSVMKFWGLMWLGIIFALVYVPEFLMSLARQHEYFADFIRFIPAYCVLFGFFFFTGLPISTIGRVEGKYPDAAPRYTYASDSADFYINPANSWHSSNIHHRRN